MSKGSVLIVEDEGVIALDIQHHVESFGYTVAGIAHTGARAIEKMAALRPDLVLMDVAIKGPMDGIDTAARIRASHDVPIVFLSAYSDESTVSRAGLTAPYGYLLKPFRPDELRAAVEVALVKHATERQLRQTQHWFAKTLHCIGDAVIATDAAGRVRFLNPVAERLLARKQDEALGRPLREVFSPFDEATGKLVPNPVEEALATGETVTLVAGSAVRVGDDETVPIDDAAAPIVDDDGTLMGAVLVFRDISERRRTEAQLAHLAHHDPLTGLPNRTHLSQWLENAVASAGRRRDEVAVVFVDLDGFKLVNDTLGHHAGDQLLKVVGERLRGQVRATDLVGRIGGDEFVLVLTDIAGPGDVGRVVDKCIRAVAEPVNVGGQEVGVTASAGISLFPSDGQAAHTLIRNADNAMYRAKELGKNNVQFYTNDMTTRAIERLTLERDLRRALAGGEFVLHHQPIVRHGRALCLEALVRWRSRAYGLVEPGAFIQVAEETGLIVPLGEWVLQNACEQTRRWRETLCPTLRVAVNLSARQFRAPSLLAMITDCLARTGLPADALDLELTESSIMHDVDRAAGELGQLNEMGVRLWIDDFGTGYSSLDYLRRFPLHGLKIDRSFVAGIPGDADDAAIVRAIVALGHSMKLDVVGEGVETTLQRDFLARQGCDAMQGFLFSRPVAAAECERTVLEPGALLPA